MDDILLVADVNNMPERQCSRESRAEPNETTKNKKSKEDGIGITSPPHYSVEYVFFGYIFLFFSNGTKAMTEWTISFLWGMCRCARGSGIGIAACVVRLSSGRLKGPFTNHLG